MKVKSLGTTLKALGIALLFVAFTPFSAKAAQKNVHVMSYNVENLFDTEHDAGKDDWDFLPTGYPGKKQGCAQKSPRYRNSCLANDWTEEKLQIKLNQIKKIVLSNGFLPDVLAVQEIENENVTRLLAETLGYKNYIIEEGSDKRGIDVALLYNETNITYLDHQTKVLTGPEFEDRPTRDILAVYFEFPKNDTKNGVLALYVNHWPSQAAPSTKRVAVAKQLKKLMIADKRRYGRKYHALAMGDLNTIDSDWPHPIKSVLTDSKWNSHLLDVQALAKRNGSYRGPLGTYFFPPKMAWNFLDKMLITQNLKDSKGMEIVLNSFEVINPDAATKKYTYRRKDLPLHGSKVTGVPFKYNHNAKTPKEAGFSDHFGIIVKVRYR